MAAVYRNLAGTGQRTFENCRTHAAGALIDCSEHQARIEPARIANILMLGN
jgi:NAD-dependent DNA ligase